MSERYVFDEEDGFFVDMARPDDERPDLGIELLTSEVLELLNDPELEKLVRYVRAKEKWLSFAGSSNELIVMMGKSDEAYAALSDETRKAIEDE
jgi:hypothetical protein